MAALRCFHRMVHTMRFVFIVCMTSGLVACSDASSEKVVIETIQGKHHSFTVELAITDEQRALGLMNRDFLPANHGMLFDFGAPQEVTMWMKNTLIPLDMVFIKEDGLIARVEHKTEPLSTRVIYSGDAVRYVLEVNGGTMETHGIKADDRVILPTMLTAP